MATKLYLRDTRTAANAYPRRTYHDLVNAIGNQAAKSFATVPTAGVERFFIPTGLSAPYEPVAWWSSRLASEVTISGGITFSLYAESPNDFATPRFRVSVVKVTSGGSDIETLIASGDFPSTTIPSPTAAAATVLTMTPPSAVTVAVDERLVARVSVYDPNGGTVSTATLWYDSNVAARSSYVQFTEALTFKANFTRLYMRSTTGYGIGTFKDLTTASPSATNFSTTNTTAGGTEIPITATAGGAVIAHVSPRLKKGWTLDDVAMVAGNYQASESATAANATTKVKLFRRQPDGTETLAYEMAQAAELTTTLARQTWGSTAGTAYDIPFAEDDRIVQRIYVVPAPSQTMGGSRTVTVYYEQPTLADELLDAYDVEWKAEADPAASPIVPSGQSMTGVSNGQ